MSNINLNNNSKRSRERREIDREHYKNNFFRKECIWPLIEKNFPESGLENTNYLLENLTNNRKNRRQQRMNALNNLAYDIYNNDAEHNSNVVEPIKNNNSHTNIGPQSQICLCGRKRGHCIPKDVPTDRINYALDQIDSILKNSNNNHPTNKNSETENNKTKKKSLLKTTLSNKLAISSQENNKNNENSQRPSQTTENTNNEVDSPWDSDFGVNDISTNKMGKIIVEESFLKIKNCTKT